MRNAPSARPLQLELFGPLASELEAERREREITWCLDCRVDALAKGDFYALHTEVWLEANPDGAGMLCLDCLQTRLGRPLARSDFSNAPLNDYMSPARLLEFGIRLA